MTLWRRLTEPSRAVTDPDERRRARLLTSILLPLLPIALASALFAPWVEAGPVNPLTTPSSIVGLSATLLGVAIYVVSRTRHYDVAAVLMVSVSTIATWGSFVVERDSPQSSVILAFVAIPVLLSGILLPVWMTFVVGGLLFGGTLALPFVVPGVPVSLISTPIIFIAMLTLLVGISSAVRLSEARHRKEAEDAMRGSEERYRNLVETSPDGIVVLQDAKVVYANTAAAELFDAPSAAALVGLHAFDLLEPEYREPVAARMTAIQAGATTDPLEVRVKRFDGSGVDVEVMGAPTMHDGRPADQSILRDITARKEAARAEREIERLREVNAVKTQLLNTASHELNTPIAALRLQLHMLKSAEADLDPKRKKALQLLDRNVERLGHLVRDVLDVARMQSGQLRIRRELVDLGVVVRESVDFYVEPAKLANVTLSAETHGDLRANADAERVTQVLLNLVSNGLKFTPDGGTIRVVAERVGPFVRVSVQDSGRGLSPEQIARLFQPFSQVHDTSQETRAGTGLGLHISRGIVEQHGGRIWCESEGPGKGARFVFEIPA